MGLPRRVLTVLLLPIVVFVFMIGWIFYWMGELQNRSRSEESQRKLGASKSAGATEDYVEVGLIEDLMEKQLEVEE
jgi:Tfp pilus assembly protein PilO